jgi:hypothetical protein
MIPAVARVDSIAYLDTLVQVYNLEVAGFHTYFVGRQGVLVHNDCEDLLDEAGDVVRGVSEGSKWLDDLETLLGAGTKTKISSWIEQGLDADKLKIAFEQAADKGGLYNLFDKSTSIYERRLYTGEFSKIPGLTKGDYALGKNNPLEEIPESCAEWGDPRYDLPASVRKTFSEVKPLELKPNTKLYRVCPENRGGGAYWTLEPPKELGDVIGGTAVLPEWNNFAKVYEYTVPAGGIKVWVGPAAKQRVSGKILVNDYYLEGGTVQVVIPEDYRMVIGTYNLKEEFANALKDVTQNFKKW